MSSPILAIAGPHGSGKSSVAKKLAKKLNMTHISAGQVFRDLAKERNVTLEQLSEDAENEPEIDIEIDNRTKELGSQPNTIIDAQLAAYFTPKNTLLKIYITASPKIRYTRIASRDEKSLGEAETETKVREVTERKRFKSLYDIEIDDLSPYDIIINTDNFDENTVFELCLSIILKAIDLKKSD